jgi:hypothetical protein
MLLRIFIEIGIRESLEPLKSKYVVGPETVMSDQIAPETDESPPDLVFRYVVVSASS